MKSEKEIRELLEKCHEVCDWGMSRGPCPLNDPNDWRDTDKDGNIIDPNQDVSKHLRGCCAECSLPSALRWILDDGNSKPNANGQDLLIESLKGE